MTTERPTFATLAEALSDLVWLVASDGRCTYVNPQWARYTGVADAAESVDDAFASVHHDDAARARSAFEQAAADGSRCEVQLRIRRHDGVYRWFRSRATPTLGDDGGIASWIWNHTDIQDGLDAEVRDRLHVSELEHARQRLSLREAQLVAAQELTRVGSWDYDLLRGDVTWSEGLFRIFGLASAPAAPRFEVQARMYAPESWERLQVAVARAIEHGEDYALTLVVLRADGASRTALARGKVVREADGRISRLVGSLQDVTEQESVRLRVEQLAEGLLLATTSARMGVWDWDLVSDAVIWDEAMSRLYEFAAGAFTGRFAAWLEAIHRDDRQAVEATFRQAIESGSEFDCIFRVLSTGGHFKHLRCRGRVHRASNGTALRLLGVNWDVTERLEAERELKEKQALLGGFLRTAGTAIIATDAAGTISSFNLAAEKLLGYRAEELVGQETPVMLHDLGELEANHDDVEPLELAHHTSGFASLVRGTHAGDGVESRKWTWLHRDGTRVPVRLTASRLCDDTGLTLGYLFVGIDLSAQETDARSAVASAPSAGPMEWQPIDGIDTDDARERLHDDWPLFVGLAARLQGQLQDLMPLLEATSEAQRVQLASRMYQLRAAARNVGARELFALAKRVDEGLREGALQTGDVTELRNEAHRLCRSVAQSMLASPLTLQSYRTRLNTTSTFVRSLRDKNVVALSIFPGVSTYLSALLGDQGYEQLEVALDHLDFGAALEIVESVLPDTAEAS